METDNRRRMLRRFLRPAVRLALRLQIPFADVAEALRSETVGVAAEELRRRGKKVTTSAISIMSGINRRDVKKLIAHDFRPAPAISPAVRVLGLWEQDRRFKRVASKGPRNLTYGDDTSEFSDLVRRVTRDVSPGTILRELERLKAVERTPDGLKMISSAARIVDFPLQGLELLCEDINTLNDAAEHNLFSGEPQKNVHLRTEYDNIAVASLPKLREQLVELGMDFHRRVRDLLAPHDKDFDPSQSGAGGARVVVGAFSLTSEPSAEK